MVYHWVSRLRLRPRIAPRIAAERRAKRPSFRWSYRESIPPMGDRRWDTRTARAGRCARAHPSVHQQVAVCRGMTYNRPVTAADEVAVGG